MKKRDRDWLERQGFRPALENSGRNPFLREHLPAEDIRPLERASIVATHVYPAGMAVLWLGIGGIGSVVTPWFMVAPAWLNVATVWFEVVAGAILLFFGYRAFHRINAAWEKALQHCYEAGDAGSTKKVRVWAQASRVRVLGGGIR